MHATTTALYFKVLHYLLQQGSHYVLASPSYWQTAPVVLRVPFQKGQSLMACYATEADSFDALKSELRSWQFPEGKIPEKMILVLSKSLSAKEVQLLTKHLTVPFVLFFIEKRECAGNAELMSFFVPILREKESETERSPLEQVPKEALLWERMLFGKQLKERLFFPRITWIFSLGMILLFLYQLGTGLQHSLGHFSDVLNLGAIWGPDFFIQKEFWRGLSALFVHVGLLHLVLNGVAFWYLGRFVECVYGSQNFLFFMCFAGTITIFTTLFFHPFEVTCGSSGLVFGLFGALLAVLLRGKGFIPGLVRQSLWRALLFLGILNGSLFLWDRTLNHWGHLGGFCGGFLGALCLSPKTLLFSKKLFLGEILILFCFLSFAWGRANTFVVSVYQEVKNYEYFLEPMRNSVRDWKLTSKTSFSEEERSVLEKYWREKLQPFSLKIAQIQVPYAIKSVLNENIGALEDLIQGILANRLQLEVLQARYLKQQKRYQQVISRYLQKLP